MLTEGKNFLAVPAVMPRNITESKKEYPFKRSFYLHRKNAGSLYLAFFA